MNKPQKLPLIVILASLLAALFFTARPIDAGFAGDASEKRGTANAPLQPVEGPGPGWAFGRLITLTNSGAALTDYPIRIALTNANFNFSVPRSDGADLRFYDSDDTTALSHWIESYNATGQTATIWVKVPSIPASASKTIYMYYGNPSAASTSSGAATFELFDDEWSFSSGNPVMTATQLWWESQVSYPVVFEDTSFSGRPRFHMLYDGHFVIGHAKGYAWSSDLVHWTEYDNGLSGSARINPTMGVGYSGGAQFACGDTIKVGSVYHMYPSQGPGTTVHAQSTDLIHWTNQSGGSATFDPLTVTDPAGIGSGVAILKEADGITPIVVDGRYWMVYFHGFSGGSMYLASAPTDDLLSWTTCCGGSPLVAAGGWDSSMWTPSFARIDDRYYVYYQGMTGAGWALGFVRADAYSGGNPVRPDNAVWTKSSGPVVTGTHGWDTGGCQDPMLRRFDGTYYLFYTGTGNPWTNGFVTSTTPEGPWTQYSGSGGGPAWTRTGMPAVSNGVISFASSTAIQSPGTYLPGRAMGFRGRFYQTTGTYKWGGFISGTGAPFLNIETLGDSDLTNLTLTTYSSSRYWAPLGPPPGEFHIYEIAWLSGVGRAYIDHASTPAGSLTSAIPTGALPVQFRNHSDGTHTLDVDWVYVRPYRDPEPGVGVGAEEPTAVLMVSFRAEAVAGRVMLTWETVTEIDTLGYNVYRSDAVDGELIRLNGELIPGRAPGSPQGQVYHWSDGAGTPGRTYYYRLEALDIEGGSTVYGPVAAVVPEPPAHTIYLPVIRR